VDCCLDLSQNLAAVEVWLMVEAKQSQLSLLEDYIGEVSKKKSH
jgi:hypothetical protein